MISFSASCSFTILPNSFGLPALPLRMTSVDGSNRLSSLPSLRVLPRKMRALVCFMTCLTRGIIRSSSWRRPSSANCSKNGLRALHSPAGLLGEPFRLADHAARRVQQARVALLQLVMIERTLGSCHPSDLQQPQLHTSAAIAQLRAERTRNLRDLSHDAR